jgi:hypothetical protein
VIRFRNGALWVWTGLLVVAFGAGAILRRAGLLPVDALPPLHAHARLVLVPILPALVVGVVGVAVLPMATRRLPWRSLLLVSWGWSAVWAVTLQLPDGVSRPLTTPTEYLAGLPAMGDAPLRWLRGFTEHLQEYPTHVKGHPPLPMLILWTTQWTGLGGAAWAATLIIGVGSSTAAAIAITVRRVTNEETARRAIPFVVLAPTAIWVATSMDALFCGVTAWSMALLATAQAGEGRRSPLPPGGTIPIPSSRPVDGGDKRFHRLWITWWRWPVGRGISGGSAAVHPLRGAAVGDERRVGVRRDVGAAASGSVSVTVAVRPAPAGTAPGVTDGAASEVTPAVRTGPYAMPLDGAPAPSPTAAPASGDEPAATRGAAPSTYVAAPGGIASVSIAPAVTSSGSTEATPDSPSAAKDRAGAPANGTAPHATPPNTTDAVGSLRPGATAFTSGLLLGALPYLSYGLLSIFALPLAVLLRTRPRRALLLAFLAGCLVIPAALTLNGFNWWDGMHETHAAWAAGAGSRRPYAYFLIGDLAVLALITGPATAYAIKYLRGNLGTLFTAAALGVIALDLSGVTRGEVERIWLPYAAWMTAAAAATPLTKHRGLLAAQALTALIIEAVVSSPW